MKKSMIVLLQILAGSAFGVRAIAQPISASLVGTVTKGSAVTRPKANISATEMDTCVARQMIANGRRNFCERELSPGLHSVTALVLGFNKEARTKSAVAVNTTTRYDFRLTGAPISGSVLDQFSLLADWADVSTKIEAGKKASLVLGTNLNSQNLQDVVPRATPASIQYPKFSDAASPLQMPGNGLPMTGNNSCRCLIVRAREKVSIV